MNTCRKPLILLICASLVSSSLRADELRTTQDKTVTPPAFVDVALSETGQLAGTLIDSQGLPIAGVATALHHDDRVVGETITAADGTYLFAPVAPGVYRLTIDKDVQMIRAWSQATRPPAARSMLTTVRRSPVVRGQLGGSIAAQIGLAVGIGGAIAAGIAISESRDAKQETEDLRRLLKVTSP